MATQKQLKMREEIDHAIAVLQKGGVILYPTETVWGLGCDATNDEAVEKIYKLKQRQHAKSMIILVHDDSMLNKYVKEVPSIAWDLIDCATEPMTIIYPEAQNLPKNLIAEDGSIAIRKIHHEFCSSLLQKFRKPIVSTSANISNTPTPKTFLEIQPEILNNVDYVVNLPNSAATGKSSSIIKVGLKGEIEIIRK
jgi:L-threonylcarbamoyladenylate synthase